MNGLILDFQSCECKANYSGGGYSNSLPGFSAECLVVAMEKEPSKVRGAETPGERFVLSDKRLYV